MYDPYDPSQYDSNDPSGELMQRIMAQQPSVPAAQPAFAGDQVTSGQITSDAPRSDSGGTLNTSPFYTPPPPGPNASAPRPSVDASVVYTDTSGNAYDPPSLATAWNTPSFRNDPINARVGDILAQYGYGGPQAAAPAAAAPAASAGGGTSPASSAGAYGLQNGYAAPPVDTSWRDSIRQIIMKRLAASQEGVDENDPAIQAAMSGARNEATRASTTERNQLAERLYAQGGLNTDAITQGIQQSNERMGGQLGTLRGNIMMSRYRDKMSELTHLLDLATQTGDTEQAQKIQLSLSNLQATLQREGLGVNMAQFLAQLNQNSALAGLN